MRFLRMVKTFSIISFVYALLNILAMLYLILIENKGIDGIYISSIIISPIAILVSVYLLKDNLILYIGKIEFKNIFYYSAPLIPASIAYLLMNTIDRLYIKDLMNFESVGIYGIAFKFSTVITIILTGFTMAMNPITFQNYGDKKYKLELAKMLKYFIGLGSLGYLILSLFSVETLIVFTQKEYYAAAEIMPILYLSVIFTGMGMFSPGINIAKKTMVGAGIIIGSALINLVLNYYFIIWFDLFGAAGSTLIAVIVFYVVYFLVAQKYYYVDLKFSKYLLPILLNFCLVFIGCYLLNFNFTINLIVKISFVLLYGMVIYFNMFKQKINE
jgi:O-antigen/teichoic acid export membrane protein